MTTSEAELFRALPGWQRYGNRIEKPSTSTTSVLRRPLTLDDVAVAVVTDKPHPAPCR
jgi:hypothetical protein